MTALAKAAPAFPALELETAPCPACGDGGLQAFYALRGVPINSCILMHSREEALSWPRGDLRLCHCPACGFVTNTRFDRGLEYSGRYEETQAFSGTFNAFARDLARRLVDRWEVRDRTVLEIGCGKGEFLLELCQEGANRGIGVDPGYRPERTTSPLVSSGQVRFCRDFYASRHLEPEVDVVVCRHTLEHIAPVRELVEGLRRDLGGREDVLVFFEVPDILRVLREGAFWDLYHEHCSYFSPGSLARLFRGAGFEVLDLWLDYDEQYVMLVARPAPGPTTARLPLEDDRQELALAVQDFAGVTGEVLARWRGELEEAQAGGERPVLWGSGSKGVAFLSTLGGLPWLPWVVDINPHKQGKFMPGSGQEIVAPARPRERPPGLVVLMNPIYREEVQRDLDRLGLAPRLVAV